MNPALALEQALQFRSAGEHEQCVEMLTRAISCCSCAGHPFYSASIASACAYELAITLHCLNRHAEAGARLGNIEPKTRSNDRHFPSTNAAADAWSSRLRFTHRLTDCIWSGGVSPPPLTPQPCSSTPPLACIALDNALPPPLLSSLVNLFATSSDFWSSHSYPSPAFFR